MPSPAISRKEMISRLVDHSVANALSESQPYWMREIFENGFVGYRRLSDQQLRLEMQLRGLEATPEGDDEDADDDFQFGMAHI